ncbi:CocE/NonD family hydrolase [Streptomyces pseudovenezuelae]|uniref:CocE/NonD family hydrolase n=1 Tax=Streptomyces pseudovenezuelae TaxID=67350 RepID=UPI00371C1490
MEALGGSVIASPSSADADRLERPFPEIVDELRGPGAHQPDGHLGRRLRGPGLCRLLPRAERRAADGRGAGPRGVRQVVGRLDGCPTPPTTSTGTPWSSPPSSRTSPPPALNIGAWCDLYIGQTLRTYTTARRQAGSVQAREGQRLIIGPWDHMSASGVYPGRSVGPLASAQMLGLTGLHVKFFDRWLRGDTTALDSVAPVKVFVMVIDLRRDEQEWPLPDTQWTDFHLTSAGHANTVGGDGALTTEPPTGTGHDTYLYDPRRPVPTAGGASMPTTFGFCGPVDQRTVASREDVLCFAGPVLEEAVEVTGPVSLTLYVSSSALDTDFTAKLVDVFPDGKAINLCDGILRARYRDGLATEELMEPGTVYEITVDMTATSNVFLPGHRIRVDISSSNFPRYDRNTNTGGVIARESEEQMIPAVNHIHHGPDHPSRLVLPVIDRKDQR